MGCWVLQIETKQLKVFHAGYLTLIQNLDGLLIEETNRQNFLCNFTHKSKISWQLSVCFLKNK